MVMALRIIKMRKVQPCRKIASAPSAMVIMVSPTYQPALWPSMMYSSASHETGLRFLVMILLYLNCEKTTSVSKISQKMRFCDRIDVLEGYPSG